MNERYQVDIANRVVWRESKTDFVGDVCDELKKLGWVAPDGVVKTALNGAERDVTAARSERNDARDERDRALEVRATALVELEAVRRERDQVRGALAETQRALTSVQERGTQLVEELRASRLPMLTGLNAPRGAFTASPLEVAVVRHDGTLWFGVVREVCDQTVYVHAMHGGTTYVFARDGSCPDARMQGANIHPIHLRALVDYLKGLES